MSKPFFFYCSCNLDQYLQPLRIFNALKICVTTRVAFTPGEERKKCEMLCCQFCWQSVRAQKRSALPGGKSHYDKSNCDKSCPQQLPLPSLHTGWNLSGNWVVTWKKRLEASMAGEPVISRLSVLTSNRSVSWPVWKHECLKKRESEKQTKKPFFWPKNCYRLLRHFISQTPHISLPVHSVSSVSDLNPSDREKNMSFVGKYWVFYFFFIPPPREKRAVLSELARIFIWWNEFKQFYPSVTLCCCLFFIVLISSV